MGETATALTILGSVVAICLAIMRIVSNKQKPICKEMFEKLAETLEKIKKDTGDFVTKEACMQKAIIRDNTINERFKAAEKCSQLEYENLTLRIQGIERIQDEKFTNIAKKIEDLGKAQKDIQDKIEKSHLLLLEAIREIKKNGNGGNK